MAKTITKQEKRMIGKEVFDRLLETRYDVKVKEEVAQKYGVSATTIYKAFNEYKNAVVEPKPTFAELELLEQYIYERFRERNNNLKSYKLAEEILKSNEEGLLALLDKYGISQLISKINMYIKDKPEEKDNIALLNEIKVNLIKLNQKRVETRREERISEQKNRVYISNEGKNVRYKVVNIINDYLTSNDIYPHFIMRTHEVSGSSFRDYLNKFAELNDPEITGLVDIYKNELKNREEDFLHLVSEIVYMIENDSINILDFYRKSHMTINKFKTFMTVALVRHVISASTLSIINDFFDKYQFGTLTLRNIEDALNISYSYNGVSITENDIREICNKLHNENIPINRYSIILTFEEKVKNRVNIK